MVIFLLKSSACLAVFLLFYTLLLEKERMHTFKRYYLLIALLIALVIPSITFVEYIETTPAPTPAAMTPVDTSDTETFSPISGETAASEIEKMPVNHWPKVLWAVYGLGVLLFSLKFLLHLRTIVRNVRNHPKIRIDTLINVLLKDSVVPHTFLNYIFLNQQKFEADEIPKEVLIHEATHARQKHSWDILFVELLQLVFWFNPLIHLAKKAIKLNHEFLADEAVLEQGASTPDYQKTLLAFASSAEYKKHQPSMANAINYSSIKKRFTIMKTHTSKKSILIRTLLILPLFALLLYGFSTTVQIPKEKNPVTVLQEGATKKELSEFNSLAKKYNATPKEKRVVPSGDLKKLEGIYGKMTEEQKADAQPFPECPDPKPYQEGATKKQVSEYNTLAKKYNRMLADNGNIRIKKSDVDRLEYLHGIMTQEQRAKAEPFPDFPEPPEPPLPPSTPDEHEVEVEAEVEEDVVGEIIENQEVYDDVNVDEKTIREIVENQDIIVEERSLKTTPFWNLSTEEVEIYLEGKEITYAQMKKMEREGMITSMNIIKKPNGNHIIKLNGTSFQPPSPPTPPKPKSPLEILQELKKENVKIILDGKEIDYEEAEKLFEESSFTRVNVRKETGGRPVLEVFTK